MLAMTQLSMYNVIFRTRYEILV